MFRAKIEALEMFSKNMKLDLSHAIRISLSTDFSERTY